MRPDLVFLFSNTTENPDRFFQGYLFHNADYVFGEGGFEAFRRARGLDRLVREDGCYVQAEKQHGGYYRFSADYHGYKKLFYFRDDGFWVVSNSLYRISTHLRQHGYRVLPDASQLAAMATEGTFYRSGRGSFFSQLTSFDTIIRGVRLVPADCALWIGSTGVRLEKTVHPRPVDDYPGRLGHFIGAWNGRLNTLLKEPAVRISCDLTGGLDSRAVLALLISAARGGASSITDQLQIRSSTALGAWKDRAAATRICEHFGLSLNGRLPGKPIWLDGETSYSLWKDLCLGVYHPIYFPGISPLGDIVHLGGGGGENHRRFYGQFQGAPSSDTFVARRTRNIALRSARPGFEVSLERALDRIMDGSPEYLDALACHYRHFRNRFHAGREPQYAVTFQPLASKLLDSVTAVAGKSRFRNAQIHYDILYNLKPELLDIPFDRWRKRPGRRVRRNLTPMIAHPVPPGMCFIDDAHVPPAGKRRGKRKGKVSAIDRLCEEFHSARTRFAADFLGEAYIRRAERALRAAARKGSFPTPIQSKRVSVVMACAMFED